MPYEIERFLTGLGVTLLWSAVATLIVVALFEVLQRRYGLLDEIFKENSVAAALVAAAFILGIFYAVVQIVIH